jgi:hypothetical protein
MGFFLPLASGEIAGEEVPTIISMLGWAGDYDQCVH